MNGITEVVSLERLSPNDDVRTANIKPNMSNLFDFKKRIRLCFFLYGIFNLSRVYYENQSLSTLSEQCTIVGQPLFGTYVT